MHRNCWSYWGRRRHFFSGPIIQWKTDNSVLIFFHTIFSVFFNLFEQPHLIIGQEIHCHVSHHFCLKMIFNSEIFVEICPQIHNFSLRFCPQFRGFIFEIHLPQILGKSQDYHLGISKNQLLLAQINDIIHGKLWGGLHGQVEVQKESNFGQIIGQFWAELITYFMENFVGK